MVFTHRNSSVGEKRTSKVHATAAYRKVEGAGSISSVRVPKCHFQVEYKRSQLIRNWHMASFEKNSGMAYAAQVIAGEKQTYNMQVPTPPQLLHRVP